MDPSTDNAAVVVGDPRLPQGAEINGVAAGGLLIKGRSQAVADPVAGERD